MLKWLKKNHIIHYWRKWKKLDNFDYVFPVDVYTPRGRRDELWVIEMRTCRKCTKRQVRLRNVLK